MRLLFVHNVPIWDTRAGGGQRVTHELATHAARGGQDVWMIHVGTGGADDARATEYGIVRVRDRRRLVANAWGVAVAARRWAREHPDGAVLASAPEAGLISDAAPRSTGVVATCHHPDPPPLPVMDWARSPLASLASLRTNQSHFLHARMLRGAHVRTVPSAWSREALYRRGYLERRDAVEVVPNGVASAWLAPAPEPVPDACDILFVGRLDAQKGVDVLLRALARPELGDATARLVGTGPDERPYRAQAAELGLADRVRFDGFRDHAYVRACAASARALVLPSRAESFGMVALEAMAAGLPVVASAVGGIPEFARPEGNALLVPPDDPAALAVAVRRVLTDESLRSRLVEAGRATASQHTWESITARYAELAAQAADRARAATRR